VPYDMIWLQKNTVNSQGDTEHERIKNLIRTIGAKFVTARRRQKIFPLLLIDTIFHSFYPSHSVVSPLLEVAKRFFLSFISMKNLCMCEMMLCKEFFSVFFIRCLKLFSINIFSTQDSALSFAWYDFAFSSL